MHGSAVGRLFAEQHIGWQLELAAEKALPLVAMTPLLNMFSNVWRRINHSLLFWAIYGRRRLRAWPTSGYIFDPACW